jgi:hypothetical protein
MSLLFDPYEATGFYFNSEEDFFEFCEEVAEKGKLLPVLGKIRGEYYLLDDYNNIELWAFISDENTNILSIPFYKSENKTKVRVKDILVYSKDSYSGGFSCQALIDNDLTIDEDAETFSFNIYCPNWLLYQGKELNKYLNTELNLLAQEIKVYENEESFSARIEQEAGVDYASISFFPIGAFDDEEGYDAILCGEVIDAKLICNEHSQQDFYWILVKTQQLTVNILVQSPMLDTTPDKGNYIYVYGIMTGKIDYTYE